MAREWIIELRKKRFPNQAALAKTAGITASRYSRIEKGYCDLLPGEAAALAKALGTSVSYIERAPESIKEEPAEPTAPLPKAASEVASEPIPSPSLPIRTDNAVVAEAPPISPATIAKIPAPPPGLAAARELPKNDLAVPNNDLSAPANFALLPPTEALERGSTDEFTYRALLQKHVAYATKVLHTSRVRPAIWTAWRNFEREAQQRLRGAVLSSGVSTYSGTSTSTGASSVAQPKPAPAAGPQTSVSTDRPVSRGTRGNKNFVGHFIDVAKESLPNSRFEELRNSAAAEKEARPEMGFMKHFVRLAEERLEKDLFSKIRSEATRRTDEPFAIAS